MEHEGNGYNICNWGVWNDPQRLVRELEKLEIRGWVEAIQTIALLRLARIQKRVVKTWGD